MSLRRDTVWTAAETLIGTGAAFAFRLFIARVLSPDEFGVAAIALTTQALLQVFVDFGFTATLIQRDSRRFTPSLVRTTFTCSCIASVAIAVVAAAVVAPLSARYYGRVELGGITAALSLGLLSTPLSSISSALLYREKRFKDVAVVRTTSVAIGLLVAAVSLVFTQSAWVVVIQTIATQFAAAALFFVRSPWKLRFGLCREDTKEIFSFSGLVLANDLVAAFSSNIGVMVIARMLGASDAGLYSLATYMTDSARRALTSIYNRVMFVHYSASQHDFAVVRESYVKTVRWNCQIIFPVMACFALFTPPLLVRFLGAEWSGMNAVLAWLSLSAMFLAVGGGTSIVYRSLGRPGVGLGLFLLTTFCFMLPGVVIGAFFGGLEGAAVGTAAGKGIAVIFRQAMLDRLIGSTSLPVLRVCWRQTITLAPLPLIWLAGRLFSAGHGLSAELTIAALGGLIAVGLSFRTEMHRVATLIAARI
jgi:teichuronic acid exporter